MNTMNEPRLQRDDAIDSLARRRRDEVVVSTMTAIGPWMRNSPSANNLVCTGFMGGASTLGLGVALSQPDLGVWVLDGDGSLLMQLGSLVTIADAVPRSFLHVVFHNGVYEVSGGQPLPGEGGVSFAGLAAAAGYAEAVCFDSIEALEAQLDQLLAVSGPVLIELMTEPCGDGYQPPPPLLEPTREPFADNWRAVRDALEK
ncbi:MAG: hypothetical protein KUG79_17950 [Pseudomonadales bacterium]|nr:hypothetical protein [Pseudomonadales bacterium]